MEDQVLELRCIAVHGWNENVTCLLASVALPAHSACMKPKASSKRSSCAPRAWLLCLRKSKESCRGGCRFAYVARINSNTSTSSRCMPHSFDPKTMPRLTRAGNLAQISCSGKPWDNFFNRSKNQAKPAAHQGGKAGFITTNVHVGCSTAKGGHWYNECSISCMKC